MFQKCAHFAYLWIVRPADSHISHKVTSGPVDNMMVMIMIMVRIMVMRMMMMLRMRMMRMESAAPGRLL